MGFSWTFLVISMCLIPQRIYVNSEINRCLDLFYTLPECVDSPDGYNCECGAGFYWNSAICVSAGVDSKMTFIRENKKFAYSVLQRKTLSTNFTLSVWIRGQGTGTVVSFKNDSNHQGNILRILLVNGIISNHFKLRFELSGFGWTMDKPILGNQWHHLVWTQTSPQLRSYGTSGVVTWDVYVNGSGISKSLPPHIIPRHVRGELILGQSSRDEKREFDPSLAFHGDMTHFHLWNISFVEQGLTAQDLYTDCSLMFCGNLVQWAQLRYGTRGNLQLKWPSGVYKQPCHSIADLQRTCEVSCSQRIGAQCNAQIKENIPWPRTKALNISYVECPSSQTPEEEDLTVISGLPKVKVKLASRLCNQTTGGMEGEWNEPHVENCISASHQNLVTERKILKEAFLRCQLVPADLRRVFRMLVNLTSEVTYTNPIDVGEIVDVIELLSKLMSKMGNQCSSQHSFNPSSETHTGVDIRFYMESLVNITNNLLSPSNEIGWNATRPPGEEGKRLAQVLDDFYAGTLRTLVYLNSRNEIAQNEARLFLHRDNIIFKLNIYNFADFEGEALPSKQDLANTPKNRRYLLDQHGTLGIQMDTFQLINHTRTIWPPDKIALITAIYPTLSQYLPKIRSKQAMYHTTGSLSRDEEHVNTAIFHVKVFLDGLEVIEGFGSPIKVKLFYTNNFNISVPKCAAYVFDRRNEHFSRGFDTWQSKVCFLKTSTGSFAICECQSTGLYAMLTNMFDVNWKKGEKPNPLLEVPSYIGCTVSALFCFISCIMLIYMRAYSNTASIHRNFSLSVVGGQLAFMCGIDKFQHELVCQSFAILLHYFFLASFSWLMNEAFNLYIVITYAAHSHDHTDGSMWRYYLLGWIMPAVLVGSFVGANGQTYYAKNMCWIDWEHVWLFIGPAISVVCITVLVLVFTAKEHHESSYTKNEKANKAIVIHTKALWTQVILLSIAWSFAFVSVMMRGVIIKYLYGMFNCLQGLFFIVFYFLLNEEVQTMHQDKHKRLALMDEAGDHVPGEGPTLVLEPLYPGAQEGAEGRGTEDEDVPHEMDEVDEAEEALQSTSLQGAVSKKEVKRSTFSSLLGRGKGAGTSQVRQKQGKSGGEDDPGYELVTSV